MADRTVRMYNPTHRFDTSAGRAPTSDPTIAWSHEFQEPVQKVAVWDEAVYMAVGRGIVAIDLDGTPQWHFQTDEGVQSSPAVVDGTVYVGSLDGNVYAIDTTSGTEQWCFQTDAGVEVSPAVVDSTVYVGSGEHVYALDTASGNQRWAFETDGWIKESSPAVVDSTVYIGSRSGHFYALDAVSGNQQWSFKIDLSIRSSPAVVDGTVHVGSIDRHVYAIDATSGTEQRCFQTEGSVSSSPVVKNRTVYVVGGNTVYALGNSDTGSGETELFETCSACQAALTDYDDPAFCPSCGADLSDPMEETQIYDP